MLIRIACVLIFFMCLPAGSSGDPGAPDSATAAAVQGAVPAEKEFVWQETPNSAFSCGEKLEFRIRWGMLKVGDAMMHVSGIEDFNGRYAYHLVVTARSYPFFDAFYKVRNQDETWIDRASICSLKSEKKQDEGGFVRNAATVFDHVNGKYYFSETDASGNTSKREGSVPPFVQDPLSALYRIRTYKIEVGKEYCFEAFSSDRTYPLRVCVYRKERIKVPAGEFECFVVEPFLAKNDGLFKAAGNLLIWLTADEKKMPVLMKSKIFVGSITAELKSYSK